MKIQILVDNPSSWIIPYAQKLSFYFKESGHDSSFITHSQDIVVGDILFLLGCEMIMKEEILRLNKHNIVVHESALPQGRGWSPLTWQVLEGKKEIPISLLEAAKEVDSGDVYLRDLIALEGHELVDELREKQGQKTIELSLKFVASLHDLEPMKQLGSGDFYKRRRPADSELDPNRTINEQFNLLRVCDNERYPAYFYKDGIKYIVKIFKAN